MKDMTQNINITGPSIDPLAVEVTRGAIVESCHAVDAAVVDSDGKLVEGFGDIARAVYPRSACKPLQALPLVETGAADAFDLSAKELALACASHAGEPVHVTTALGWLARLGLGDDDLECGAHLARNPNLLTDFVRSGEPLRQANNNCSGKHTAMLSHAVHRGDATAGYIGLDHPVQRRVADTLAEMYRVDLAAAPVGTDGCGIPTFAVPLEAMAAAMARLANPHGMAADRADACRRVTAAMVAEPYMVAGRERCCTQLMSAAAGRVVAKTGAEGVYFAGIVDGGLGIALKVRDGAGRAAEVALGALLVRHGALSEAAQARLVDLLARPVPNVRGRPVGVHRTVSWDHRETP